MAIYDDEINCAGCQVPWKYHTISNLKYVHPMFWSNLEYLEWLTYERDYKENQ